jgi:penicillin-binding protein 1A
MRSFVLSRLPRAIFTGRMVKFCWPWGASIGKSSNIRIFRTFYARRSFRPKIRIFFSHSGVDYSVFPRLLSKINVRALTARVLGSDREHGSARADVFPQGGSTITQELVRGYFLQSRTSAENNTTFPHPGVFPRMLSLLVGVRATKQFLLKVEVIRLSLWLEGEMQKRYGSKRLAKEELFARYANFIYLGNGRYGFAAASQFYFDKPIQTFTVDDADKAALLAGITKSPGEYAPTPTGNEKALRRRNQILALMVANHFLTPETARRCQQAPIRLAVPAVASAEMSGAVGNVLEELKSTGLELGSNGAVSQLLEGRIHVFSTIDERVQRIANKSLETGLKDYEKRHPHSAGLIQGSVVILRNSDSAILGEIGGRDVYQSRLTTYADYNRVTRSLRQPGSAMKPILYLAAFRQGAVGLDTLVPDAPISVSMSQDRPVKWIANYDGQFKGMIPARQALAESRNAVAVWMVQQIGIDSLLQTARDVGIRTTLHPYDTTALGASEVTLLELANAYRFMASGIHAQPYVIQKVVDSAGETAYNYSPLCCSTKESDEGLSLIQEGLRGVVRIPSGTAHALDSRDFPIPVMGKTGTTNDYRDALFVGSTYGPDGITVAVRIGFDDNRSLGAQETGAKAALPVFREIMLKTYQGHLAGAVPSFPADMEENINAYLKGELAGKQASRLSH